LNDLFLSKIIGNHGYEHKPPNGKCPSSLGR